MPVRFTQTSHRTDAASRSCAQRLTKRQIECISLVGQGKTDWEIGLILGISEQTAKRHIADARNCYGVATRIQVVLRALSDGMVSIGELVGWQALRIPTDQRLSPSDEDTSIGSTANGEPAMGKWQ
jgi:DNA-binding CsgD family transcriptional regulator